MKFYIRILNELQSEPHTLKTVYGHAFSFAEEVAFEYSKNLVIHRVTYARCRQEVLRISALLNERCAGDKVIALIMPNCPLWVECFWAVLVSGRKVMLISPDMPVSQMQQSLAKAGCSTYLGDVHVPGVRAVSASDLEALPEGGIPQREPESGWGDEVILTTSGTTGAPEVYSYTGREICSQISDSKYVLKHCSDVSRFWKGQFRQLAFLPFSHIFGLTACYLWFAIFGRTFVFLEDFAPATILRTCRLHHVTHIFAVPVLWDKLAEGIKAEAEASGQSEKLEKGLKISTAVQNLSPALGRLLVPRLMRSVRSRTLGDAVSFCISGGGLCNRETFRIINGCGYHLENGYGMTEIGIAAVTLESRAGRRTGAAVGRPFPSLETRIDDNGHLLVRGASCYDSKYTDGEALRRNPGEWFDTGDCFEVQPDGQLVIRGRADDMINGANGERICPDAVEAMMALPIPACIFLQLSGIPAFIVQVTDGDYVSAERRQQVSSMVAAAVDSLPAYMRPSQIYYTRDRIPVSISLKYRRREIASYIADGRLKVIPAEKFRSSDDDTIETDTDTRYLQDIMDIMAQALGSRAGVTATGNFFTDFGGDSLSYMEFLNGLETRFRVKIPKEETAGCITALSACRIISGLPLWVPDLNTDQRQEQQ